MTAKNIKYIEIEIPHPRAVLAKIFRRNKKKSKRPFFVLLLILASLWFLFFGLNYFNPYLKSLKSFFSNTKVEKQPVVVPVKEDVLWSIDRDEDGLSDYEEELYGTNPEYFDTDGDNYGDKTEIENGYNPLGEEKLFINYYDK